MDAPATMTSVAEVEFSSEDPIPDGLTQEGAAAVSLSMPGDVVLRSGVLERLHDSVCRS